MLRHPIKGQLCAAAFRSSGAMLVNCDCSRGLARNEETCGACKGFLMKTSPATGFFKSTFISLVSSHALNSSQVNSLAGSFHPNSNINESTTSCNCTRLQIQLACEISLRINKANVQCRPWWDHRCAGHTPLGCPAAPTQLPKRGRGST